MALTPTFLSSPLSDDESTPENGSVADGGGPARDFVNVSEVRACFPGLAGETALFNNASGTVVLKSAIESASNLMASSPLPGGSDPKSREAVAAYVRNKEEVARFLNAGVDEITFGQSTSSLLRVLGTSMKPLLSGDCEMVCSTLCHEASASAWIHLAAELGVTIKWWSPDRDPGNRDDPQLTVSGLVPLLTPKTRIVTCNHVSNVVGTIHPIRAIADAVHDTVPGAVLIVDGVAYAPHRPIDVCALGVDFYCFSWYKVFGPHLATLYASRRAQDRHLTRTTYYFVQPGTLDGKLQLGMPCFELQAMCGPVARHLRDVVGWAALVRHETALVAVALRHLVARPSIYRVFGRRTPDPLQRVSIVTFEVRGRQSADIAARLHARNRFRVAVGECLAPRPTRDVLRPESTDGLLRISFVHYNTVAEVEAFCYELGEVVDEETCESASLVNDL